MRFAPVAGHIQSRSPHAADTGTVNGKAGRTFGSGEVAPWEDLTRRVAMVFIDWMTEHRAHARILLSNTEGSVALEAHRRAAFHSAAELTLGAARQRLRPGFDEQALRMDTVAGVGAFIELLRAWQSGHIDVSGERVADHIARSAALFSGRLPAAAADGGQQG